MYNRPLFNFTYNNQIYNLILPKGVQYSQEINDVSIIIHNETLDGRLQSDYRGLKYEISIAIEYVSENVVDDNGYYIFNNFKALMRHLLACGTVNFYPHGPSGLLPPNLHRLYQNCLAKDPKWINARAQKITDRWNFNFVLCTNEIYD